MKRLTWKHIVAINVALLVVIIGGFYIRKMVKESYLFDEHLKKGSSYMNQGKWGPASVEFAEASKIRPESYETNYGYGAALLKLRQLDTAVPALENAVRINPEAVEAHYSLGIAYHRTQKYDLAMREYKEVLKINPQAFQAYSSIGSLYTLQGKYNEAMEAYSAAQEINPDYHLIYMNKGYLYEITGKPNDAIKAYGELINLSARGPVDENILKEAERRIERIKKGKTLSLKKK
ncbi:MAG: hypothetical protein A2132_05735 [Nitrospirae bacterium RBG_16_43_11]|nr:MAG: hypothetical protein A2132_05735 [Nitrospirae bacterium RBG_16_43_11]